MKATLHLLNESTTIHIDLPEAQELAQMRANLDVYANCDCVLWTASTPTHSAQVVSHTPNPGKSLKALSAQLKQQLKISQMPNGVNLK